MHNLIPHFIHDQFQAGHLTGELEAVTLFMDISGFTAMTQQLMSYGKEGAEFLADIINRVFEPIIYAVYEHGGFITGFAGDAFTAVFPIDHEGMTAPAVAAHVATTTLLIGQQFAEMGVQRTPAGAFTLAVKQGVSHGQVTWGIVGPESHFTYFFSGEAIDGCAHSEHQADKGDIILDQRVLRHLPQATVESIDSQYGKLLVLDERPLPMPIRLNDIALDVAERFFPREVWLSPITGEFRNVGIVFISFQGINTAEQLNAFAKLVITAADQYGGYCSEIDFGDKGGLILLYFGAPVAYENNTERQLNFILEVRRKFGQVAALQGAEWRAGLTTGVVYAGLAGISMRGKYTTLGSVVNFAARLMAKAAWGQALASDVVADENGFAFEHLGAFAYKGFAEPVDTFTFVGRQAAVETGFDQPLIGREQELQQLAAAAKPLFDGRFAGTCIIYGEPGIGKSHLAFDLQQQLGEQVLWFTTQTDQILRQAFNPFIYFLRSYFEQSPERPPEENKARFEARWGVLKERLEGWEGGTKGTEGTDGMAEEIGALWVELARTRPFLGALLDLHWPDSLYEQLDAEGRYQNTIIALKTLLLVESCLQPVVFELEDGHALDEASQEVVLALTRNVADFPLWLVITSRYNDDGQRPEFGLAPDTPQLILELEVLSPLALRALAEAILGAPIDHELHILLQERTGANPYFVQQFLYYFREHNLLEQEYDPPHLWRMRSLSQEIPTSINLLLVARIDRLPSQLQEVVKTAAVVGRTFETPILDTVLAYDVQPRILEAMEEQIWAMINNYQHLFRQSLLRDAAYEMQLRSRLRELHTRVAQAFERLHAADLSSYYPDLAHHYGQAQDGEREREYAYLSGVQAASQYANHEALRYFSRALELTAADQHDHRYNLLIEREQLYDRLGLRAEQLQDLVALEVLTAETKHPEQTAEVLIRRANYARNTGEYEGALSAAQEALATLQQADSTPQLAQVYFTLGKIWRLQGEYVTARQHLRDGLLSADEQGQKRVEADILLELGNIYRQMGQAEEARHHYQQAAERYHEVEDMRGEAGSLTMLGAIDTQTGRYLDGRYNLLQALQICQAIGYRMGETFVLGTLGVNYEYVGEYRKARSYQRRNLTIASEIGDLEGVGVSYINLANISYRMGAYGEAAWRGEQGLTLFQQAGHKYAEGYALTYLGHIYTAQEEWSAAEKAYQEALETRTALGEMGARMDDLAGLALGAWRQGEMTQALLYVEEVTAWLGEHGVAGVEYPFDVYYVCYQVLSTAGKTAQAEALLKTAGELLQQQADAIQDKEAREMFLQNIAANQAIWQETKEPKN